MDKKHNHHQEYNKIRSTRDLILSESRIEEELSSKVVDEASVFLSGQRLFASILIG
jgi:hypothetical protein